MTKRDKGIIAYGTDEDRKKLLVLAQLSGKTASDWIIREIRKQYETAFGNASPRSILGNKVDP